MESCQEIQGSNRIRDVGIYIYMYARQSSLKWTSTFEGKGRITKIIGVENGIDAGIIRTGS